MSLALLGLGGYEPGRRIVSADKAPGRGCLDQLARQKVEAEWHGDDADQKGSAHARE